MLIWNDENSSLLHSLIFDLIVILNIELWVYCNVKLNIDSSIFACNMQNAIYKTKSSICNRLHGAVKNDPEQISLQFHSARHDVAAIVFVFVCSLTVWPYFTILLTISLNILSFLHITFYMTTKRYLPYMSPFSRYSQ